MKICIISEPWKLPAKHYGGTERIISLLCEGLIERGYEVNLMAGKGTYYNVKKLIYYKNQSTNYIDRFFRRVDFSFKSVLASYDCDVIHTFKFWPSYHTFVNKLNKPIIYSNQGLSKEDDFSTIKKNNPKNGYLWVTTKSQLSNLRHEEKRGIFIIPMALDTNTIKPIKNPKRNYLAYLGRLNHDKGIDLAVKIALETGEKLKIAGEVRPLEKDAKQLFDEKVKPYLGKNIEFVGKINDQQKSSFLGNAKALLMPNRWDEPFGLVMAEALSTGTPIIGTNRGSIPEIITDGKDGFLCNNLEEMIKATKKLNKIDPINCREKAMAKYSKEVFIDSVIDMYKKVISYSK